jgi:hypothetical protein
MLFNPHPPVRRSPTQRAAGPLQTPQAASRWAVKPGIAKEYQKLQVGYDLLFLQRREP